MNAIAVNNYREILVFHNNCEQSCKHCVVKPSPACDLEETEKLINSLQQGPHKIRVYFSDQTQQNIRGVIKRLGYNTIELKDKVESSHVKELAETKPVFGFSLHGHRADIHELICQKGNFHTTIHALKEAKRLHLPNVRIYSVVHGKNYRYVEDLCNLLEEYNVSTVIFLKLTCAGMARRMVSDMFLDTRSYVEFFHIFENVKKKFRGRMEVILESKLWGPKYSRLKISLIQLMGLFSRKQKFFCKGGREKITIHSKTKEVFPCYSAMGDRRFCLGYYDEDRGIIIKNSLWLKDLIEKIGEPCKSCKLLWWCGGHCRGSAISEHLRLSGEFDIYAGHSYCPVALGIIRTWDTEEIRNFTYKLFSLLRQFFSQAGKILPTCTPNSK